VMRHLRPEGASEFSGTYLAHSTAVLAARAALDLYWAPGFYERLSALGERFYSGFTQLIDRSGVPVRLQHVGARFGLYFGITEPVTGYRAAARQRKDLMSTFVAGCIRRGAYVHLAAHHGFSAVHDDAAIDTALNAIGGRLRM
jgi:glutamate-1-semialdehyde 2,1-aminomutase